MTVLLTINIVALIIFGWASFFWLIPSALISQFRYRLWLIRDLVIDDIYAGLYSDPEPARALVQKIEGTISLGSDLTLFKVWLSEHLDAPSADVSDRQHPDLSHFDCEERRRFRECQRHYFRALSCIAFFGSPSGWFYFMYVVVKAVAPELVRNSAVLRVLFRTEERRELIKRLTLRRRRMVEKDLEEAVVLWTRTGVAQPALVER